MKIRPRKWKYEGKERTGWQVEFKHPVDGKRVRLSVPETITGKREAKAWGEEREAEARDAGRAVPVEQGATIPTATVKPGTPQTLGDVVPKYLAASELHDSANTQELKGVAMKHVRAWGADIRLADVTPGTGDGFAAYLKDKGLGPASIQTYSKKLHGLLTFAEQEGWIAKIPRFKHVTDRTVKGDGEGDGDAEIGADDWLPFPESEALIKVAVGMWLVLYVTAIQTGMRPGELCGVRRKSVILDSSKAYRHGYIAVVEQIDRRHPGKTIPPKWNKSRRVPLTQRAHDTLATWLSDSKGAPEDPVFPDKGSLRGWLTRSVFGEHLAADCKKAGIKVITPHKLRHTFASQRTILGMSPNALMIIMGHASLRETQRYQHLGASDVDDALARTEAAEATRRATKAA